MKFLFFSPHALADSCSGAARCVHTLLEELTKLGHECRALTGSVVDGSSDLFARALATPAQQTLSILNTPEKLPLRRVTIEDVDHLILGARGQHIQDFLALEETALMQTFFGLFEEFQPDVLLTYGGFSSNYVAGRHALSRGRKSVLFVATVSYDKPAHFQHVNHVLAVSQAMAARLNQATTRPITVLSALVQKAHVKAAERKPDFITFINPVPSKGLILVAAIVRACQDRGKPYKFLFVEGRGTKADALHHCPGLKDCRNLSFAANVSDMRAVYERTSLVLYPSLWFESAGRVPIEANTNGIPVIAHSGGGIAEMLDGAGYLLDPPDTMRENWYEAPPPEYVDKWLALIDRLQTDSGERGDAEQRARDADARYDIRALAEKFVNELSD